MQTTFKTTILATLLATAMSASYAAAPTAALNHDPATYRNVTQKAAADFKLATNACKDMSGNPKNVCMEEAKAARAHTEADAVAQYNNTSAGRAKARNAVADADFAVAKAKCQDASGAEKDSCLANAAAVRSAAIAEVKADRAVAGAAPVTTAPTAAGSAAATREANAAAAVEKCAEVAGAKTGCLIDNRSGAVTTIGATGVAPTTTTTTTVAPTSAEKIADQGRAAAATVAEKTREVAATVADKTRSAVAKTEVAAEKAEVKSAAAARKTSVVVADSVITTKVKADIFKEPELKSMAIHVETEKGVVMLSGFVDAKADADKAVALARNIEGVTSVKSAIKVK
jgi:hyperosmotically inducible protein